MDSGGASNISTVIPGWFVQACLQKGNSNVSITRIHNPVQEQCNTWAWLQQTILYVALQTVYTLSWYHTHTLHLRIAPSRMCIAACHACPHSTVCLPFTSAVHIHQLICSFNRSAVIEPRMKPMYEACPQLTAVFDHWLLVSDHVEGKDDCWYPVNPLICYGAAMGLRCWL